VRVDVHAYRDGDEGEAKEAWVGVREPLSQARVAFSPSCPHLCVCRGLVWLPPQEQQQRRLVVQLTQLRAGGQTWGCERRVWF
jgi:hypothetical protein